MCTGGLLVLCLLRTPLRFIGGLIMGGAIILMLRAPQPDVLVAADGSAVALRGANGRLSMIKSGNDVFAFREWLAADADPRTAKDDTLGEGIRCDAAGCIGKLRDGSLVAIAKTSEAFEEDCRRAVVVVSSRDAPPGCAALVIDRNVWRGSGAMALRRRGNDFEITAGPRGYDRPWARAAAPDAVALAPSRAAPQQLQRGARESIAPEQPHQLALNADAIGRKNADLVGGVCWLECNRGAAATETLEGGLFVVDQRDHDVAGIGALRLLE
jgi:competence protein ComEC